MADRIIRNDWWSLDFLPTGYRVFDGPTTNMREMRLNREQIYEEWVYTISDRPGIEWIRRLVKNTPCLNLQSKIIRRCECDE